MAEAALEDVSPLRQHIQPTILTVIQVRELFKAYDSDSDDSLTLNELATLLQELGNKITSLPAVSPRSSCLHCMQSIPLAQRLPK